MRANNRGKMAALRKFFLIPANIIKSVNKHDRTETNSCYMSVTLLVTDLKRAEKCCKKDTD
jgi:hypothetical protein